MNRRTLVAVVALGVVVRLAWCAVAARQPAWFGDPFSYLNHARDIADGAGYVVWLDGRPTAYYPPGYPAVLGGALWLVQSITRTEALVPTIVAVNVVAATVTIIAVHGIGRRLGGERVGIVAAALAALWPSLVLYAATAHLELVFTALVVVAVWVAVATDAPPSMGRAAGVGAAVAGAVLVRPLALPVVAVLLAWWWRRIGVRRAVQSTAAVVAVVVVVAAPWSIRSTRAMNGLVLVSTNTGDNLCIGHSPQSDGQYHDLDEWCWPPFDEVDAGRREVVRDRENRSRAVEYALEHPGREAWLLWRRLVHLVRHDHEAVLAVESYGEDPFLGDGARTAVRWLADGWYVVAGTAGVVGAVQARRARVWGSGLVLGAALTLLMVPLAFFGGARLHLPALPFACVFAAYVVIRDPRPAVPSGR